METTHKIIVTPLGEIKYQDKDRIFLPRGIPGFEDVRYAVWLALPEYEPVKWIVLENEQANTLPLFDPFLVLADYNPMITEEDTELLEPDSPDDLAVLSVMTPRENEPPTLNLRSPLVINVKKQIAVQVILEDESLPIRYAWKSISEEDTQAGAQ